MRTPERWSRSSQIVRVGLLCFLTILGSAPAAEPQKSESLVNSSSDARALLGRDLSPNVPGFTAAVAVDGKLIWSVASGYADLEQKRAAAATTRFRIGSVSKSLTAAGLMRLVDQGLIDLDAPVQRYLPTFPVKAQGSITARLLAGHLAGIRHYRNREQFLNQPFANVQASLKIFEIDPLVGAPGEKFSYSSYGWVLISAVIESASHRDFLAFMESEVFQPLGLNHTRPDRADFDDPDRTKFYLRTTDGKFVAAPTVDSSYMWAGGGFLSTAEDLVRFGSAMLIPGFLTADSQRLLFKEQTTTAGESTGYGIGWFVSKDGQRRTLYYHDGAQHGATAVLFMRPQTRAVVAILCNVSDADIVGKSMELADLFAPLPSASIE